MRWIRVSRGDRLREKSGQKEGNVEIQTQRAKETRSDGKRLKGKTMDGVCASVCVSQRPG